MQDLGKLVLRVGMGGLMLTHGYPKMLRLFSGEEIQFGDPLGIGVYLSFVLVVFAEFICSILVIIGYKTRLAVIPLIFAMMVAAFIVHMDDPFSRMEKPLMYIVGFVVIFLIGPGFYSIDDRKSPV